MRLTHKDFYLRIKNNLNLSKFESNILKNQINTEDGMSLLLEYIEKDCRRSTNNFLSSTLFNKEFFHKERMYDNELNKLLHYGDLTISHKNKIKNLLKKFPQEIKEL